MEKIAVDEGLEFNQFGDVALLNDDVIEGVAFQEGLAFAFDFAV